jgi:hypothetical protein
VPKTHPRTDLKETSKALQKLWYGVASSGNIERVTLEFRAKEGRGGRETSTTLSGRGRRGSVVAVVVRKTTKGSPGPRNLPPSYSFATRNRRRGDVAATEGQGLQDQAQATGLANRHSQLRLPPRHPSSNRDQEHH